MIGQVAFGTLVAVLAPTLRFLRGVSGVLEDCRINLRLGIAIMVRVYLISAHILILLFWLRLVLWLPVPALVVPLLLLLYLLLY